MKNVLPATDPRGIVEKGEPVSRINAEMYCILRRDSGRRVERKSKTFDIQWPSRMGIGVGVLERKCDKGGAYENGSTSPFNSKGVRRNTRIRVRTRTARCRAQYARR